MLDGKMQLSEAESLLERNAGGYVNRREKRRFSPGLSHVPEELQFEEYVSAQVELGSSLASDVQQAASRRESLVLTTNRLFFSQSSLCLGRRRLGRQLLKSMLRSPDHSLSQEEVIAVLYGERDRSKRSAHYWRCKRRCANKEVSRMRCLLQEHFPLLGYEWLQRSRLNGRWYLLASSSPVQDVRADHAEAQCG